MAARRRRPPRFKPCFHLPCSWPSCRSYPEIWEMYKKQMASFWTGEQPSTQRLSGAASLSGLTLNGAAPGCRCCCLRAPTPPTPPGLPPLPSSSLQPRRWTLAAMPRTGRS